MMRAIALLLCGAGALTGCQPSGSRYDAEASRGFRAAWEKRRAGDEAGYRAALGALAKKKGTLAGDRAAVDLEIVDETNTSSLGPLLKQAAQYFGTPSSP